MPLDTYVTDYANVLKPLTTAQVGSITDTLNEPPSCDFQISQDEPNASWIGGLKREIRVVESLGSGITPEIVFQGPVLSEDGDNNVANFQCEGVLTHFNDRIIDDASLLCTSIEQRTIGYMLLAYAQSEATQANRDLNVDYASFAGTTHIRSQNYDREEHAVILDLLREFPTLVDGFDYEIVIQADGARLWTPYYPKKGSYKPELALQFELGGQRGITSFSYRRDWKSLATQVYCVGGTDGITRQEQNYEDTAASDEHGVRQRVMSDSNLDTDWLLALATKKVNTFKQPVFLPQIKTARVPIDYRRLLQTGDTIPIVISRGGRVQETGVRRVLQKSWNVADDTLDVTFTEVDAA
jgi:hypothetical protein